MKIICILTLLLFLTSSVVAKRTIVSTASEISSTFWFAGDTIVLKNGTWTNQSISLRADGTSDNPIVMIAETRGEVILTGSSKLSFSGKYIIISGLYFKDGNLSGSDVISYRTSSSSLAENCRVTECAIKDYNPAVNTVDSKWVSIYGANNKIDHCSFENKTNSGTLLVVWLKSGITPNHIIDQNYFGYRNANLDNSGNELNGQEIIRIGDSSTSMQPAGVVVTNNFFEHCNGEIEVISNKSGENYYSNNIFYECKGMLTLRHGNGCVVDGNYFIGNGVSSTGGVRIIGENHKVYNNYFENLTGTNYRSAICLVRGKENSALNEYFQVKNALVVFNTMVNCSQAFSVNYNSNSYTMPPIGTTIAHNHVYNTSSSKTNVSIDQTNVAAMNVSWKNNLMNQGKYYNFTYLPDQVITGIDPKMVLAGTTTNMYEPESGTGLSDYVTSEYNEVVLDIRGRGRANIKLPGASQVSGVVSRFIPRKDSIGASYLRIPTSAFSINKRDYLLKAYSFRNQLITDVPVPGVLKVYDLSGRSVFYKRISAGINRNTISRNGIFLINFKTEEGEIASRKLMFTSN